MLSRFLSVLIVLLTFLSASAGVSVRLIHSGSGNKIMVGEKFQIVVTATGRQGELKAPVPPGGEVIYRTSEEQVVNGAYSTESTLTILATNPGSYSFYATFGSTKSNILKYTITDASGAAPSAGSSNGDDNSRTNPGTPVSSSSGPQFIGKGNENMFLRASVSKSSAYEQEAIVYTIRLYTSYNYIKFLGATAAPKFDGFVVEEDRISDAQQSFETVNGRTYKSAVVARYIIFPQKPGKLRIAGNTYTVSADAMEYYNDPYFRRMMVKRPVQLNITPNDLTVDVKSLPEPRPADFSGGVGKFSISSRLPQNTFKTNQASTIVYTVSGSGNLKYINMPDLAKVYPSQLEVFSPESEVDAVVRGSNVEGRVIFKYSFMPVETGDYKIPPVRLVYFNPETGQYESAEAHGYDIHVSQGSASDKSQTVRRFNSALLPVGKLVHPGDPWILSFIFWLWFILPAVLLIAAVVAYVAYMKSHSDMEALKSRRAGKLARRRLRRAEAALKKKDADAFYNEMLSALWGYMAHKLKMPTSELTRQNILEVLLSHGVSDSTANKSISLIDECEFAKYSPSGSVDNMTNVYDEGASVITSLDSEFSKHEVNTKDSNDTDDIF